MNKMNYESPNFDFNEMKLTEAIAEQCWGKGWAWVDHDADRNTPPKQYWFNGNSMGCAGYDDETRLKNLVAAFPELADKVTLENVHVNTKDSEFIDFIPGKS